MYSCTLEKFLCEFILCSKGRLREMDFRKHLSKPCYFLLSAATTFFRRIGEIMDLNDFERGVVETVMEKCALILAGHTIIIPSKLSQRIQTA